MAESQGKSWIRGRDMKASGPQKERWCNKALTLQRKLEAEEDRQTDASFEETAVSTVGSEKGEVRSAMMAAIRAQDTLLNPSSAPSDETLQRNNEDGSAPSHSTLALESGRPQSVNKLIDWVSVAHSHRCSSPQTAIIYRNTADKYGEIGN